MSEPGMRRFDYVVISPAENGYIVGWHRLGESDKTAPQYVAADLETVVGIVRSIFEPADQNGGDEPQ